MAKDSFEIRATVKTVGPFPAILSCGLVLALAAFVAGCSAVPPRPVPEEVTGILRSYVKDKNPDFCTQAFAAHDRSWSGGRWSWSIRT